MDKSREIIQTIDFFRGVIAIVMALALGESFKQFVSESVQKPEHQTIHWNRLPALVSFLFLIVPFYQGMIRYFVITYGDPEKPPQHYSLFLMFDGVTFIFESALFFLMSQALSLSRWRRFYVCVLILLVVDLSWLLLAYLRREMSPGRPQQFNRNLGTL
jgi:ABC-type antimicrobial peptide transport system permease subunit